MSASANQLSDFKKQQKKDGPETATLGTGAPIGVKTASQTVGRRGPILLQDINFIDEMAHFDRERIPERVVHAKGAGAFGYFEVTHDITKYCGAKLFEKIGKRTPLAVRFSTVAGENGSADTVRNPRGFAIKFYTEDGIWDLVGNNTPIFFIRDPIFFPSLIHSHKRNPQTHLSDADMFWDFASLRPETTHQLMFLFADRGIPDGYRYMNGHGSHTFKMVNWQGEAFYVKFHLKTSQGIKNMDVGRAKELAGSDPDYAIRDLFDAIARGDHPSWIFCIQVMSFEEAESLEWNPFDVTKVWPQKQYPYMPVGRLVLDRNPTNYFAEVEQIAFCPSQMVPGIEPSPDKMLQGRLFSYVDTHRYRLGPNYRQIPVNCPYRTSVKNYQRDGAMCVTDNQAGAPNYYPNSFGGPEPSERVVDLQPAYKLSGDVYRYDSGDEDNFSQPRVFWNRILDAEARKRLVSNIASHMANAKDFIKERAIKNFSEVSPDFGQQLREAINLGKKAKM